MTTVTAVQPHTRTQRRECGKNKFASGWDGEKKKKIFPSHDTLQIVGHSRRFPSVMNPLFFWGPFILVLFFNLSSCSNVKWFTHLVVHYFMQIGLLDQMITEGNNDSAEYKCMGRCERMAYRSFSHLTKWSRCRRCSEYRPAAGWPARLHIGLLVELFNYHQVIKTKPTGLLF